MPRMPTLFVSHGAPTFAMDPGLAGPRLQQLAQELPRPHAVVVVSPHWMTRTATVSAAPQPETIHDFGGFPRALYELQYPAHGDRAISARVAQCLQQAGWPVAIDERQGLDHGAWVPMMYLYPQGDVPVVQVSMPHPLDAAGSWRFGEALAPLADEGVLIVASGSMTHNLYEFRAAEARQAAYVVEFSNWVRQVVESGDLPRLQRIMAEAPHASRAHPTTEHLWPLLIAAGAAAGQGNAQFVDGGVAHGVLAMDAVLFGVTSPVSQQAHPTAGATA